VCLAEGDRQWVCERDAKEMPMIEKLAIANSLCRMTSNISCSSAASSYQTAR
jgi:hypothetical protein